MGLVTTAYTTLRRLPKVAAAAALGWTAFSAFRVPHDVAYPRPVPGEAGTLDTAEAGQIATYQMGPEGGENVVLIHGVHAAASAYDMGPLYTALATRGKRVSAFDLPGFGHSERSNRTYDPALMTRATTLVLERLVQAPAHVVALSLGSEYAARAALERPDLVRSLTLVSPTGLGRRGGDRDAPWLGAALRTPVIGQALFDLIASRPSIAYFLGKSFVNEPHAGYRSFAWLSSHQPGARYAPAAFLSGALFDAAIFEQGYARVTHPGLVLHDRDAYTTFDRLPELVARPNWSSTRIVPTNGLPHFELLAPTIEAMERFWDDVGNGDRRTGSDEPRLGLA